MRRNFVKLIILGTLLLLTPVSFMLGRRWRSSGHYQWKDTPGENISLPDEVSGQVGFGVCASRDGQFIAVAGNRVIPQQIFEGVLQGGGVESAMILLSFKHFVYLSSNFGRSFGRVLKLLVRQATPLKL